MADTAISGFTADTTPVGADLIVTAKSPFGAGSNRKVTLTNLFANATDITFPASGATISFYSGDVTISHSSNTLAFSGADIGGYQFNNTLTDHTLGGIGLTTNTIISNTSASGAAIAWASLSSSVTAFGGTANINGYITSGFFNAAVFEAAVTVAEADGVRSVGIIADGTATLLVGGRFGIGDQAGTAITTIGLWVPAIDGSYGAAATIGTSYGLKVDAPGKGATAQWTIYSTSGNNAFGGSTSFGKTTAPGQVIDATGNIAFTGVELGGNGAITAPTYSFSTQTSMGMYYAAANTLRLTSDGASYIEIGAGTGYSSLAAGNLALQRTGGNIVVADLYGGGGTIDMRLKSSAGGGTAAIDFYNASGTSDISIGRASAGNLTITQSVLTTGSPTAFTITGGAHTTLTAATEAIDINFNLNRTVQFATGALSNQRAINISAPTYAFVGASTLANSYLIYLDGTSAPGANATFTNHYTMMFGDNTFYGSGKNAIITFNNSDIGSGIGAIDSLVKLRFEGSSDSSLGNQTATLTDLNEIRIQQTTYTSDTLTRTVTNPATVYIANAPVAGSNVTFSNQAYALHIAAGDTLLNGVVSLGAAGSLTISGGAVAVTKSYHTLVVEGGAGAGADALTSATGGNEGDILVLKVSTSGAADQVTVTDGTGAGAFIMAGGANFVMDHVDDRIQFIHNGTEWVEQFRSDNS